MARRGVPGGGVPPVRHRSESVAVETQGPGSLYSLSGCAAGGGHPAPFVTPEVVNALERHLRWLRKKRCVAAGASLVVVPERRGPPARRVMGQEGVQAHAQEREAARVLAARSRLANVCRRYHTTAGHRLSSDHLAKWRRGESNPRPKAQTRVSPQASPNARNPDDGEPGSHQSNLPFPEDPERFRNVRSLAR